MFAMRSRLSACILAGLLCSLSWAGEVPISVTNPDGLPKVKKIILGNFVLDFQSQNIKTKSGFNILGMGSTDKVTASNSVVLPEPSVLQALTDFAYLLVQEKLREQGYEVVLLSQLSEASRPALAKLLSADPIKSGDALETRDGASVLYTPTGATSLFPGGGCDYYAPQSDH